MVISEVSVPEVYKTSADFRFFLRWIACCLTRVQTNTENLIDLLDPLRCPSDLLWMLADTCGYKYDERLSVAFNRLVVLNFPHLIRNRGSETGMIYAAEVNLDQFILNDYAENNPILAERLEDTSIPVNSVNITSHTAIGSIDVVYASENIPVDACLEYVRPLGMYCFPYAGVQVNAKTKISVDARLTNMNDKKLDVGPTFVAHYRRADYASLQGQRGNLSRSDFLVRDQDGNIIYDEHGNPVVDEEGYQRALDNLTPRRDVWYRNSKYEGDTDPNINPGYRTLYSLQLSNNEHTVKSLLPSLEEPIFTLGYGPQDVDVRYPDDYSKHQEEPLYNLRIDREFEESLSPQVYTVESAETILKPKPAVNPPMAALGDAISLNSTNTKYTKKNMETGEITVVDVDD